MRRLIAIGVVSLVAAAVGTQASLTGRWRAVLLTPRSGMSFFYPTATSVRVP